MSKFIDADALIDYFFAKDAICKTYANIDIKVVIEEQPEAIVRCRDCKYLYLSPSPVRQFWCDRGIIPSKVRENDFCSFGERKTDE